MDQILIQELFETKGIGKGFYPTPRKIIEKLCAGINEIHQPILEPSAGDGSMAAYLKFKSTYLKKGLEIDCIEIEEDLRHIIVGKGLNVVHDDFLSFDTQKEYKCIVMNPPFNEGYKHLLKAIQIMESSGGTIRCLLNQETINNPYSNGRKLLLQKLEEYGANYEFISDGFVDSARPTMVDVVLISVDIPLIPLKTVLLDKLKESYQEVDAKDTMEVINYESDEIDTIIRDFNLAVNGGKSLIKEFESFHGLLKGVMVLSLIEKEYRINYPNDFIKLIRRKYWTQLFGSNSFKHLTTEIRSELDRIMYKLEDFDLSLFNIRTIQCELSDKLHESVVAAIMKVFDRFTSYALHYGSKNIHYFNGWKTNKVHKIAKKVIVPINGLSSGYGSQWRIIEALEDIEITLNYLFTNRYEGKTVREIINDLKDSELKEFETKYFKVKVYLKGTAHLTFKDDKVLDALNIFGAQQKKWLPPSYGEVHYEDMTEEDQSLVNFFQGEKSYEEFYKQKQCNTAMSIEWSPLALASGQ